MAEIKQRRREPRPESANRQAKLTISWSKIFGPDDVSAHLRRVRLDLSRKEHVALRVKLNSAAMQFHMRRDDLLEPSGKGLAKDLSEIAALARALSIRLGTKSPFFPDRAGFASRESWLDAQQGAIRRCVGPDAVRDNIPPRYLLQALHLATSTTSPPASEQIGELPLEVRRSVTTLALYAEVAADAVQHQPILLDHMKSPWQGNSWVSLI